MAVAVVGVDILLLCREEEKNQKRGGEEVVRVI